MGSIDLRGFFGSAGAAFGTGFGTSGEGTAGTGDGCCVVVVVVVVAVAGDATFVNAAEGTGVATGASITDGTDVSSGDDAVAVVGAGEVVESAVVGAVAVAAESCLARSFALTTQAVAPMPSTAAATSAMATPRRGVLGGQATVAATPSTGAASAIGVVELGAVEPIGGDKLRGLPSTRPVVSLLERS